MIEYMISNLDSKEALFFSQTDYSQNTTKNKTGEENFWEFLSRIFLMQGNTQQDVWEERRKKTSTRLGRTS